jgi:hypothetical protein
MKTSAVATKIQSTDAHPIFTQKSFLSGWIVEYSSFPGRPYTGTDGSAALIVNDHYFSSTSIGIPP